MVYMVENNNGDYVQEERFTDKIQQNNDRLIIAFIQSKRLEGLSEITLQNYKKCTSMLSGRTGKSFESLTTQDIRDYLMTYQRERGVGRRSIDNIRRVFSSFFNFLEEEDYIIKSPVRKIHRIKEEQILKTPFTEEDIILIQDSCVTVRELAIVDFLYSTGVRVSELCGLDIKDIDLVNREGVVFGKGAKERMIYFDARTKIHLQKYLEQRRDDNPALFVASHHPHNRLSKTGVEHIVRNIGARAGISQCHPHRFRRTIATRLLDRGVPIEQVQRILGHNKIETTLIYAQVNQFNVKMSHSKFV